MSKVYDTKGIIIVDHKPYMNYDYGSDTDPEKSFVWNYDLESLIDIQGHKFTFGVQTDTHFLASYPMTYGTPLRNMSKQLYMDFICNMGDISRGWASENYATTMAELTEQLQRYTSHSVCPFLVVQGNHDNNSCYAVWNGQSMADIPTKHHLYELLMGKVKSTTSVVDGGVDETYYYKDYPECRVIVLNTNDSAYLAVSETDIHTNHHTISETQIQWFKNTALNTDKPVLIISHNQLIVDVYVMTVSTEDKVFGDTMIPWNADKIVDEIEAFKTTGGTVVACLSGHIHRQVSAKVNGINYITYGNGGDFAEITFIDFDAKNIETKVIGSDKTTDGGIAVDRQFKF